MPVKTLSGMASILGMETGTLINALIACGILKQNGFPKQKLIDEGFFYPDGSIVSYPKLKQLIQTMLGL